MKTTTDAATLTFCFEEVLRTTADREHRSIANVLIRDCRMRNQSPVVERGFLFV